MQKKLCRYFLSFEHNVVHERDTQTNKHTIANKRFRLLWMWSMLPFCGLFACLPVTFVHCAQTVEDIDNFFCTRKPYIFFGSFSKFDWHWSTHSCPNFAPKWPSSCWFERRRHSMTMIRNSAMVTIGNQDRSFDWYLAHPYVLPFPPNVGPATSPFAKLLWPFLIYGSLCRLHVG